MARRRRRPFDATARITPPFLWWRLPFGLIAVFFVAVPVVTLEAELVAVMLGPTLVAFRMATTSVTVAPGTIRIRGVLRTRTVRRDQARRLVSGDVMGDEVPVLEWEDARGRVRRSPMLLLKDYDPDYAKSRLGFQLSWRDRMHREWRAHRAAGLRTIRAWLRSVPPG